MLGSAVLVLRRDSVPVFVCAQDLTTSSFTAAVHACVQHLSVTDESLLFLLCYFSDIDLHLRPTGALALISCHDGQCNFHEIGNVTCYN